MSKVRFVGLDVHADTIAIAVAEANGEVRSLGVIPNRMESIRKLVRNRRSRLSCSAVAPDSQPHFPFST
jgi:hypothetical protein